MTFRHRLAERFRPWAAPTPPAGAPEIAVIGAGPAGLATAALLRRAGVRAIVFDERPQIGGSWPDRYDSLRLNTVRWMSDLPGLRMGRSLGRWVERDELVRYLQRYAEHHRLETVLGAHGAIGSIGPTAPDLASQLGRWTLDTPAGRWAADGVVVATGHSRRPVVHDWAGAERWPAPRMIHAADYRRPTDFTGRRVLVVGAGSSGGEICVDLARHDVEVVWSVRSAPQVFPREVFGVPATPLGPLGDVAPDALVDRAAPWLERGVYGRRDYLPAPAASMSELFERCKEPMTADGIVELIRAGRVRVVGAVERLTDRGAVTVDGDVIEVDRVIAATGYRPGLESLVGALDVLDADGRPTSLVPRDGLGFVGFRIPLTGTLWAIEDDARAVASKLAATAHTSGRGG